jgi:hypothetical protein
VNFKYKVDDSVALSLDLEYGLSTGFMNNLQLSPEIDSFTSHSCLIENAVYYFYRGR